MCLPNHCLIADKSHDSKEGIVVRTLNHQHGSRAFSLDSENFGFYLLATRTSISPDSVVTFADKARQYSVTHSSFLKMQYFVSSIHGVTTNCEDRPL